MEIELAKMLKKIRESNGPYIDSLDMDLDETDLKLSKIVNEYWNLS